MKAKPRRVLFVQAADAAAYPPLQHASGIFADAGWQVLVLSAPIADFAVPFTAAEGLEVVSLRTRKSHVWAKRDYAAYCRMAVREARRFQPGLVYASDPIGALPGLLAARTAGARLVYHEHDSPRAQAELNPLLRWARMRAARRALYVVFPSAARARHSANELGLQPERTVVVWNTPRRDAVCAQAAHSGFVVHYHGSINPERVPSAAAQAVSRLGRGAILRLVGYEAPAAVGYARQLVETFGAVSEGGLIDFVGVVPEILPIARTADVGLMLVPTASEDINFSAMAGASNKAFEYMAASLPMLVSDLPEWRNIFVQAGHALAVDPEDVGSLAAALERLMVDRSLASEMGARNAQRIRSEWNYETCFAPVLAAAESIA